MCQLAFRGGYGGIVSIGTSLGNLGTDWKLAMYGWCTGHDLKSLTSKAGAAVADRQTP